MQLAQLNFKAIEMKNLSIAATLACLLVGYGGYAICDAEVAGPGSVPPEDPNVEAVAVVLVNELSAARLEVRDKAATALQAMGTNAAAALANYVKTKSPDLDSGGTIKAVTVLARIGNDIADDKDARDALLKAAGAPQSGTTESGSSPPPLQLRLAAIDALGQINKYRGGILDKKVSTVFSSEIVKASDGLLGTAEKEFHDLSSNTGPAPTPTPTPGPKTPCTEFYCNLKILHESQSRLVKLASDVNVDTSSSEKKESPFPKLADEKTLGVSMTKIEVAYLDATKEIDKKKLWLKKASDKTSSQFQTESAYGLLTETRQLNTDLHALDKAVVRFKKNQDELKALMSALAGMPEMIPSQSSVTLEKIRKGEITHPDLIRASVGNALNAIFSKPPKKKTAAAAGKKEETKKDAAKTDTTKKEDDKKATDNKDSDSKDSDKSDEDGEDSTTDE